MQPVPVDSPVAKSCLSQGLWRITTSADTLACSLRQSRGSLFAWADDHQGRREHDCRRRGMCWRWWLPWFKSLWQSKQDTWAYCGIWTQDSRLTIKENELEQLKVDPLCADEERKTWLGKMIVGSPNPIVKESENSKDNTFFSSLAADLTYFEGKLL